MTSKILFQSVEIENDDLNKWIKYNLSDLSSKLLHNIKLYCMVGIIWFNNLGIEICSCLSSLKYLIKKLFQK